MDDCGDDGDDGDAAFVPSLVDDDVASIAIGDDDVDDAKDGGEDEVEDEVDDPPYFGTGSCVS